MNGSVRKYGVISLVDVKHLLKLLFWFSESTKAEIIPKIKEISLKWQIAKYGLSLPLLIYIRKQGKVQLKLFAI